MLWIIALGTLLGVFFAISITVRITGPLKKMAGLLDRLAYEEPTERMHFIPGGRDEVNEMAEAVNTMADNKARFIAWWKTSMLQADACQKLEARMAATNSSDSTEALPESENQLWQAIQAKRELLSEQYREISRLNNGIVDKAEHLLAENLNGKTQTAINDIRHCANSIQNIVDMASFHPIPESERRIN
jgi:methyl-accepting chemotaxis protein